MSARIINAVLASIFGGAEFMDKLNLGYAYVDGPAFKAQMVHDNDNFKQLVNKLNLKN